MASEKRAFANGDHLHRDRQPNPTPSAAKGHRNPHGALAIGLTFKKSEHKELAIEH
jgi:hypothetical protein